MEKKTKKFIINIVPLTKIPLTTSQSFSYLAERELPAGTLVSIPLFKRKVEGIVLGARKDFPRLGNIELKNIDEVIEENFLDAKQLELARFLSDYYISPLGVVMKNFVPRRAKARVPSPQPSPEYRRGGIVLTFDQKKAVDKITKKNNSKFLLYGPSASGKTEVYIHAILELKTCNSQLQFLILVPEKTLTPQAMERYGQYFKPEEIAVLSSNIAKGQFYSNWQRIKSGEAKIIIGTRMAVFAPFKNIGLIVIDEEQDMSYKQWDMNPRYDARTVAEKLSELHKCPLVRGSATPNIETYYKALQKKYKLIQLPPFPSPLTPLPQAGEEDRRVEIVDMKKERWSRNYSCISKKLKSEMAFALKYKQQIILLINRQGMSAFSLCEACKTVLKCLKCDRALVLEKSGYYTCSHCNYKSGVFPKCAKCGGITFKNVGLGTQKVEKEAASLFPGAKILVADTSASKRKNFHAKIYSAFSKGEADILIGTQMISKGWDLPRVALVGIIDTDNMLSFPDFGTGEKAFQLIAQVSGRVARPGAKFRGSVVIQTFQPENSIIKFAAEKNYLGFFEQEIKERKELSLPPFGKIIRLVFQNYSAQKTDEEALNAYGNLKKIDKLKITQPHSPLLPKIRGRFRKQIIIKIKDGKIPAILQKELKKLPSGWIIDVDPISII